MGTVYFTTMDLTYAYGHLPLSNDTNKHCKLLIVGGKSKGTYRFKIGFYGLTTMPAEIQRVMNFILSEIPNAFAFIDDILVLKKALRKYLHR